MKSLSVVLTTGALAAAMASTGAAKNGGAGIYAIVDTVTFTVSLGRGCAM